jgi:N-dimethylarginine dimethylaminohydrolase
MKAELCNGQTRHSPCDAESTNTDCLAGAVEDGAPGGEETPVNSLTRKPPTFVVSKVACAERHGDGRECSYQVAWSINPHMRIGSVDFARAELQASGLRAALSREGARVLDVPFVHGAYDSVFTKDAALLFTRRGRLCALLAKQRFEVRRREREARAKALGELGFHVSDADGAVWEGGDVVILPDGACALLGYGPRSDRRAAEWLSRELDTPVLPLELVDPKLFHLDMALAALPDGTILVSEGALAPSSLRTLQTVLRGREIVCVPSADALAFGLNLVPVGRAVILGGPVPRIDRLLRAKGFSPVAIPLDEFHAAGGSAACLVARMHEEAAVETPKAAESAA